MFTNAHITSILKGKAIQSHQFHQSQTLMNWCLDEKVNLKTTSHPGFLHSKHSWIPPASSTIQFLYRQHQTAKIDLVYQARASGDKPHLTPTQTPAPHSVWTPAAEVKRMLSNQYFGCFRHLLRCAAEVNVSFSLPLHFCPSGVLLHPRRLTIDTWARAHMKMKGSKGKREILRWKHQHMTVYFKCLTLWQWIHFHCVIVVGFENFKTINSQKTFKQAILYGSSKALGSDETSRTPTWWWWGVYMWAVLCHVSDETLFNCGF